jgi:hypothetical protein
MMSDQPHGLVIELAVPSPEYPVEEAGPTKDVDSEDGENRQQAEAIAPMLRMLKQ